MPEDCGSRSRRSLQWSRFGTLMVTGPTSPVDVPTSGSATQTKGTGNVGGGRNKLHRV